MKEEKNEKKAQREGAEREHDRDWRRLTQRNASLKIRQPRLFSSVCLFSYFSHSVVQ